MTRVTLDYNRSAAVHQERGHVTFRQQSHLATVVISVMGLDDDKVTNSQTVGQYLSSLQDSGAALVLVTPELHPAVADLGVLVQVNRAHWRAC